MFAVILIFTLVNLAPHISSSWEWMPASLGKECSHALNLGHILPSHRHLCFVKYSRNYTCLCRHPQQSARSDSSLPCNIYSTLARIQKEKICTLRCKKSLKPEYQKVATRQHWGSACYEDQEAQSFPTWLMLACPAQAHWLSYRGWSAR